MKKSICNAASSNYVLNYGTVWFCNCPPTSWTFDPRWTVTMRIRVRDWESGEFITQVVVEAENTVAFLKYRIWESVSIPRCGQSLYLEDTELAEECELEDDQIHPEQYIDYSPRWYAPYCPGCSDCERNICSACGLYPMKWDDLWPEPEPCCSVCQPAAAAPPAIQADNSSDWLEADSPEAPASADTTAQPEESLSAPNHQLMLGNDIPVNQAEGWCCNLSRVTTRDEIPRSTLRRYKPFPFCHRYRPFPIRHNSGSKLACRQHWPGSHLKQWRHSISQAGYTP